MSSTIVGIILVVPSVPVDLVIGARKTGVIRVASVETCAASKEGQTRSTRATLRIPHLHGAVRRPKDTTPSALPPAQSVYPTVGHGREMAVKVPVK
jgi:hypothetical protein